MLTGWSQRTTAAAVSGWIYLNFGADYRIDFTAGAPPESSAAFDESAMLALPGASVRVRGEIEAYNGPFVRLVAPAQVLVHEDHGCPIVAVNVWYHVGSKNEQPGRTGFAHLFEHLMFEGSAHYDRGFFHPLQAAGAVLNGSTNADRLYWTNGAPTALAAMTS